MKEIKVVTANIVEDTRVFAPGAKVYVYPRFSGDGERLRILGRSRSGRWVDKWEAGWRLANFRITTLTDRESAFSRYEYRDVEATHNHLELAESVAKHMRQQRGLDTCEAAYARTLVTRKAGG